MLYLLLLFLSNEVVKDSYQKELQHQVTVSQSQPYFDSAVVKENQEMLQAPSRLTQGVEISDINRVATPQPTKAEALADLTGTVKDMSEEYTASKKRSKEAIENAEIEINAPYFERPPNKAQESEQRKDLNILGMPKIASLTGQTLEQEKIENPKEKTHTEPEQSKDLNILGMPKIKSFADQTLEKENLMEEASIPSKELNILGNPKILISDLEYDREEELEI